MIMKCIKLCRIEGIAIIYHISVDVKGSEIIPVMFLSGSIYFVYGAGPRRQIAGCLWVCMYVCMYVCAKCKTRDWSMRFMQVILLVSYWSEYSHSPNLP